MNCANKMQIFCNGLLTATFCFGSAVPCKALDAITKERVLAEYPKALELLESRFSHISGDGVESKPGRGVNPVEQVKISFALSRDSGLTVHTSLSDIKPVEAIQDAKAKLARRRIYQRVLGFNSKYSFHLTKENSRSDYVIEMLNPDPQKSRSIIEREMNYITRCSTNMNHTKLSQLMKNSGFEINQVKNESIKDTHQLIKIDFTVDYTSLPKSKSDKRNISRISSGWLVVSPE